MNSNVNRSFKDSVFTLLFSEPDTLRELYCALEGVTLPPDTPVFINTLEKAFFMGRRNDISFEIGGKLIVLIEHQSTINHNMALRLLLYIAGIYETIIDSKTLYKQKPISIPYPEFFVLYNGEAPYPDNKIIRLSDLYKKPQELGLPEKTLPALELEVKVININNGRNDEIITRCKKLNEYSILIQKIYEYIDELHDLEKAIEKAIIYCRRNHILAEFLERYGGEVTSMLYTEWNWDDAFAVRSEEAYEDGLEDGLEQGSNNEKQTIARNMLTEGSTYEFIQKVTGLSIEQIEKL